MPTCPSCGHVWNAKVRAKAAATVIDTAQLTDTELHAYYKRTAPVEDIAFVERIEPRVEATTSKGAFAEFRRLRNTTKPPCDEAKFWAFVRRQPAWYRAGDPAGNRKVIDPQLP